MQTSFVRGVPAVHKRMVAHGDNKPLWLTEFGWNTSKVRGRASWQNGISQSKQARYLRLAFKRLDRWSYVPAAIWFGLENTGSDPMDGGSNYGLEYADGTRKQSFTAFRTASARLAG